MLLGSGARGVSSKPVLSSQQHLNLCPQVQPRQSQPRARLYCAAAGQDGNCRAWLSYAASQPRLHRGALRRMRPCCAAAATGQSTGSSSIADEWQALAEGVQRDCWLEKRQERGGRKRLGAHCACSSESKNLIPAIRSRP